MWQEVWWGCGRRGETIESFLHFIHLIAATPPQGISVEGEENIQELLTKQLVMCQFACALSILRHGGHFVCKLFDAYTPFIIGLIYLLHRSFESVCLFKPVTSRPANSERSVVGVVCLLPARVSGSLVSCSRTVIVLS